MFHCAGGLRSLGDEALGYEASGVTAPVFQSSVFKEKGTNFGHKGRVLQVLSREDAVALWKLQPKAWGMAATVTRGSVLQDGYGVIGLSLKDGQRGMTTHPLGGMHSISVAGSKTVWNGNSTNRYVL